MKPLKFGHPADRCYRLAGWLLPILSLLIFSCKKLSTEMPPRPTDMNAVAKILDGEVYMGAIEVLQEDDGIVFGSNNWKTMIVLEKLNPDVLPTCGDIKNAEVIYSKAGIVVHNTATNETWSYVNNDRKSMKKFEGIKSYFANSPNPSLISGHIRINTSGNDW
jgi:hypothetical protein